VCDQPGVVAAGIIERLVVREIEVLNNGLAVDDLAGRHCAALFMTRGLLDAEIVRIAGGLCAPLRFQRPLRNQQLRRAAGLRFQAHRDPSDFCESLIPALIHLFQRSSTFTRNEGSSVLPALVVMRFVTVYDWPAVPPRSQTVVFVLLWASEVLSRPAGTVQTLAEI
jgi:hypothetical protein